MTLYSQQQSSASAKPVLAMTSTSNSTAALQQQPMSTIICTGPVIPSVIYHHHHMYYLAGGGQQQQNQHQNNPHLQLQPQILLPYNGAHANPNLLMSSFVESMVVGQQPQLQLQPRISIPLPFPHPPTFNIDQAQHPTNFDRSKLKEQFVSKATLSSSSSASSSSGSSAASSSYFASRSSAPSSTTCLSPLSTPPTPSSPSSSPVSVEPNSSVEVPSSKLTSEAVAQPKSTVQSSNTVMHQQQNPLLSSLTPSAAAPLLSTVGCSPQLLLSGAAAAYFPSGGFVNANTNSGNGGHFFNPATSTLHQQQPQQPQLNNVTSSSSSTSLPFPPAMPSAFSYRDYYARFGVHYTPVPWNQSYGMERVWMSEFRRIFSAFYNELWSIQPVERKPTGIKLHMFVDSAKVRFCCDRCGHSWTSMKGRIVFWFNLLPPHFNVGVVTIRLFGQKCESCKQGTASNGDVYEQPMWYPEEVTKVLMNLFNRVGQIFYGFEKTKFEKQRRLGKPRTPHNKYLCQACLEGICLSRRRAAAVASASGVQPSEHENEEDVQVEEVVEESSKTASGHNEKEVVALSLPEGTSTEDKANDCQIEEVEEDDEEEDRDREEGDYTSEDSGIVEESDHVADTNAASDDDVLLKGTEKLLSKMKLTIEGDGDEPGDKIDSLSTTSLSGEKPQQTC